MKKKYIAVLFVCVIVLWTYRVRLNGTHTEFHRWVGLSFTGRQPTGLKVRLLNMKSFLLKLSMIVPFS